MSGTQRFAAAGLARPTGTRLYSGSPMTILARNAQEIEGIAEPAANSGRSGCCRRPQAAKVGPPSNGGQMPALPFARISMPLNAVLAALGLIAVAALTTPAPSEAMRIALE